MKYTFIFKFGNNLGKVKLGAIFLLLFMVTSARAWTLGGNYNQSDLNFNALAMRVYNSNSPYIFTQGTYTYNAIPITTTASGCKLISVIRRAQGFPKPAYWAIENYEICGGNIANVENTNMAGWDNLPRGIKPVIDSAIRETRQYGSADAEWYEYRVVAKTGAYINSVYVYVLNGIKLEAMMRF